MKKYPSQTNTYNPYAILWSHFVSNLFDRQANVKYSFRNYYNTILLLKSCLQNCISSINFYP